MLPVCLEANREKDESHMRRRNWKPRDQLVLQGSHPAAQQGLEMMSVTFLICVDTALIQSSKQQVKDTNCSQTKDKLITRTPNHSWQLCLGFMGFNAEDMRLRKRLWLAAVCRCLVSEWQPLMGNLAMGKFHKNRYFQCFNVFQLIFRKDCSRLGFSPKRWIGGIFCKVEWPRVQSWVNWKYHNLSFFTTRGNRLILHFAQCSPRDQAGLWYVNRWPGKKEISNITRFWWIHLKSSFWNVLQLKLVWAQISLMSWPGSRWTLELVPSHWTRFFLP